MNGEWSNLWIEDMELQSTSISPEFGDGLPSLAKFYSFLNQLIYLGPLQAIDFLENSAAWDTLPDALKPVIKKYAPEGFKLSPEAEMRILLKKLITECSNHSLPPGEVQFLKNQAICWLDYIESLPVQNFKPASLRVDLLPSLDLESLEERDLHGLRKIQIPFAVTNLGELPALNVVLRVDLEKLQDADPEPEPHFTRTSSRFLVKTKLPFSIGAGETRVISLNLRHSTKGQFSASTEHINFLENSSDSKPNEKLDDVILLSPEGYDKTNLTNPYKYRLPLVSEEQWQKLLKGKHQDIIETIMTNANSDSGNWYAIHGLKHTGKTSILQKLRWHMQKDEGLLPVYVDLYSWWDSLYKQKQSINSEEFWYEIADSIARETEQGRSELVKFLQKKTEGDSEVRIPKKTKEVEQDMMAEKSIVSNDDMHNDDNEQKCLSYDNFDDFIKHITDISGKRLILLLDELDSLYGSEEFSDDAQIIFAPIRSLIRKHNCLIVFAHVRPLQELQKNKEDKTSPHLPEPLFIELLENHDLFGNEKRTGLAELTTLTYTQMAQKYIFNITGGWPGIVQLVFYKIVEKVKKQRNEKVLVDVGFVKNVIKEIFVSPDAQEMLGYFWESFDAEEFALIRGLVEAGAVKYETSKIEGVRQLPGKSFLIKKKLQKCTSLQDHKFVRVFNKLIDKQIIEPIGNGNTYRLRVGLLAYPIVLNFKGKFGES